MMVAMSLMVKMNGAMEMPIAFEHVPLTIKIEAKETLEIRMYCNVVVTLTDVPTAKPIAFANQWEDFEQRFHLELLRLQVFDIQRLDIENAAIRAVRVGHEEEWRNGLIFAFGYSYDYLVVKQIFADKLSYQRNAWVGTSERQGPKLKV